MILLPLAGIVSYAGCYKVGVCVILLVFEGFPALACGGLVLSFGVCSWFMRLVCWVCCLWWLLCLVWFIICGVWFTIVVLF